MAFIVEDRVRDTSTSTGVGPTGFAVSGTAPTRYRTLSAVCAVNDTFPYAIIHQSANEWEIGLGTYTSANTFTRTTIYSSSNADAAVNFSAGTKDVFISFPGTPAVAPSLELGHPTDTTLSRVSAGDIQIEGNIVYRAGGTDVPVADGGTGASTLTGILQGSGTSAITGIANSSTVGQALRVTGASTYAWADSIDLTSGNLIINGGIEVDQERAGAAQTGMTSAGATFNLADLFYFFTAGAGVFTAQQVADAPAGLENSLKLTVTTADASLAASDQYAIFTKIEGTRIMRLGWGAAGASAASLGFWVKAHRTGSYSACVKNAAGTRSYPFTFVVNAADTWEYKTKTIPGDTTGTWLTTSAAAMQVVWCVASGTTALGTADTWAASNLAGVTGTINGVAATTDIFQITGVTLIPGSVSVPQALVTTAIKPFGEELQLCMRYYEKSFNYGTAPATALGTSVGSLYVNYVVTAGAVNNYGTMHTFKVRKRAVPIMVFSNPDVNNGQMRDPFIPGDCSGTTAQAVSEVGFRLLCVQNASTTVNSYVHVYWLADARM